jgi:hypothetical protein
MSNPSESSADTTRPWRNAGDLDRVRRPFGVAAEICHVVEATLRVALDPGAR